MAAFSRPSDALEAAVEIQSQLLQMNSPLKLRMAIHTGEVQLRDDSNYIGIAVNRAARLRSIGHGGQILVSQVTHDLVVDHPPSSVSFKELGTHRLKDLARPEQVFQVMHTDLSDDFLPLRSLDALPNNLPAQRTSFIGRDVELRELARLLGTPVVDLHLYHRKPSLMVEIWRRDHHREGRRHLRDSSCWRQRAMSYERRGAPRGSGVLSGWFPDRLRQRAVEREAGHLAYE